MIQVSNKRNWSTGEYVGRPSPLGSPFYMADESQRDVVCDRYARWLDEQLEIKNPTVCAEMYHLYSIAKHGDLRLLCWCAPKRCHADIIKEHLEAKLKCVG